MKCEYFILIGLLVLGFANAAFSEDAASDSTKLRGNSTLTIQTTPESVWVILDGKKVGTAPLEIDSISAGPHTLKLQHRDVTSWFADPLEDTVVIREGEHRILRYALHTKYFLTTTPFGADVVLGDSVIGETPFIAATGLARRELVLKKPGYEPMIVTLSSQPIISTSLTRVWQKEERPSYFVESSETGSNTTGLYISGAATVLSGVAAAYFKVKADDRYQQYASTGNAHFLSQTHRLDTAAGISIALTQISLGLFTYLILSQ